MKIKSILLLCFLSSQLFAQPTQWEWATSGQDYADGYGSDITSDMNGNSYITGAFTGTLNFGSFTLTSTGGADVYLAKLDENGQVIWAKSVGGIGEERAGAICVDGASNVYIFCSYEGTSWFESTSFTALGEQDLALAKYDNNGNFLWAETWGTTYRDWGHDIFADPSGHIYLTGDYSIYSGGGPIFDTIHFDAFSLPVDANGDIFLVKADTSGSILWAKRAGSSQIEHSKTVTADLEGNVYISGFSGSTMHFESITLPNADVFIAKYDSMGNVLWAKSGGTTQLGSFYVSHTVDSSGNVYLGGLYYQATSFTFGSTTLNWDNGFIAKYNSAGSLQWAKNMGSAMYSTGRGNAIVNDNSAIYVAGIMESTATFGTDTLTSNGYNDVLVVKYDLNGNYIWSTHAGGNINDGAHALALDNNGSIIVTGYIASTNAQFGAYTLASGGAWDTYVAKLSQTTGMPIVESTKNMSVFPSPANERITISCNSTQLSVKVVDVTGRIVADKPVKVSNGRALLDVRDLPNGLYILNISGTKTINRQKIVVQH